MVHQAHMYTAARLIKANSSCVCKHAACKANNSELSNATLLSELGASRNADFLQNLPKIRKIRIKTVAAMPKLKEY